MPYMEFLCSSTDPEDFLNMLFKHTLHVEPFIHIKSVLTQSVSGYVLTLTPPPHQTSIWDGAGVLCAAICGV